MSVLSQSPSEIVTDPRKYMTLVHGDAGVGKTTWASQIEGHYFLFTEQGGSGLSVYGHPVPNFKSFLETGNALLKASESGFKDQRRIETIVIDSYDKLYEYAGDYICETETFLVKGRPEKFKKIEDIEWGKGYKRANQVLLPKLQRLALAGFGIVILAHTKERIVQWRGQDKTAYGPNLTPSAAEAIVDMCDAVGYFTIEEEVQKGENGELLKVEQGRYMYWQPTFLRTAKHRLKGFPEKMPLRLDTGWQDYANEFKIRAGGKNAEPAT